MTKDVIILIAEDDDGHAGLVEKNLRRAGIANTIQRFVDGQELLDFLCREGAGPHRVADTPYILLLDIRMPKVDGVQALERIKTDPQLRGIPVIMLTTTDDSREVKRCHELGCGVYVTKPVHYEEFVSALRQLGLFLSVVQVPTVDG